MKKLWVRMANLKRILTAWSCLQQFDLCRHLFRLICLDINSFLASSNFCCLLIALQIVWIPIRTDRMSELDQDPNNLTI